jgi:hypothetical protein
MDAAFTPTLLLSEFEFHEICGQVNYQGIQQFTSRLLRILVPGQDKPPTPPQVLTLAICSVQMPMQSAPPL